MSKREDLIQQLTELAAEIGMGVVHLHPHLLATERLEEMLVLLDAEAENRGDRIQLPTGITALMSDGTRFELILCRWAETKGCSISPERSCASAPYCERGNMYYAGIPWTELHRRQRVPAGSTDMIYWQEHSELPEQQHTEEMSPMVAFDSDKVFWPEGGD